MKKVSKRKRSIKNAFLIPMAAAMGMAMAVPASAGQIYVGDTETVVSYDEDGNKVVTLIFDPAKTPDFFREQYLTPLQPVKTAEEKRKQAVPLDEAPEVGTVLADIHRINENGEAEFISPYHGGRRGQCTWYAAGRFQEIHGIALPLFGNAKEWIANAWYSDDVRAVTDLSDVPEQAVAVYRPTERFRDWPGHVSFVEYVERDENGKPLTVYYTDANGVGDPEKDAYSPGYDGSVKAVSYEYFLHPYGVELIGYLVPKEK